MAGESGETPQGQQPIDNFRDRVKELKQGDDQPREPIGFFKDVKIPIADEDHTPFKIEDMMARPGSPEQQATLEQEQIKTQEYVNRRLNLTDAEGKPLSKDAADLVIRSAQIEGMDMMADMLRANLADGTPVDPVKYERAMFLTSRAMDAAYRLAQQDQPSIEAQLKDVLSHNVFADRKGEGLNKILNQPPAENTPPSTPETAKE